MLRKFAVAVVLVGTATAASAIDVDLNLGQDSFEVGASQTVAAQRVGRVRGGASFLFNNADDYVFSARAHVLGNAEAANQPLTYGVGPKVFLASLEDGDDGVFGIGLGGFIRVQAPDSVPLPLAAQISGHLAPDITTGAGRGINELVGRLEYRVVPAAAVYVGYRFLEFELDDQVDREVDDDFHLGIRLTF